MSQPDLCSFSLFLLLSPPSLCSSSLVLLTPFLCSSSLLSLSAPAPAPLSSSSLLLSAPPVCKQLKEKIHQLEEQLDHEMQAKDELDHKCRYGPI